MAKTTFYIPKMDCPTEEKLIQDRLRTIDGIQYLKFNLIQQELTVIYDGFNTKNIQTILINLGMEAQIKNGPYTTESLNMLLPGVRYRDWIILGLSGVLAVVAAIFAFLMQSENSPLSYSNLILLTRYGTFPHR